MESGSIKIYHPFKEIISTIDLPSSKSESNRVLIIKNLSQKKIALDNLSSARDTQTMIKLLKAKSEVIDVIDAGTTMRFLTAYFTSINRKITITGSKRMQERPIHILIDALRWVGADISYLKKKGFPPIEIKGFRQEQSYIKIPGNISSQYISALMMIAPTLPNGLEIEIIPPILSLPYIKMTLSLMKHFGVKYEFENHAISIKPQEYQEGAYKIEPDWSAASYWYSVVALSKSSEIRLNGLRKKSFQGDQEIAQIMKDLGVKTSFEQDGIRLRKTTYGESFQFNFSNCPDLAQTVAVICAAKNINAELSGLQSLRIKETDRIAALKAEIEKLGNKVVVDGDEKIIIHKREKKLPDNLSFKTYEDHRMAMAFAPLALLKEISIQNPKVVEKSYPSFWEDFRRANFQVN